MYSPPKNLTTSFVLPKKLPYQTAPAKIAPTASTPRGNQHHLGLFVRVLRGMLVATRAARRRSGTSAATSRSS